MTQESPKKKERKLPEDALKRDDRHLMKCVFGDDMVEELDRIAEGKLEESGDE